MKRLCVLVPTHWSAATGGAEVQVRKLLDELIRRGTFEIHYLARCVAAHFAPEGYTIHRVRERRAVGGTFVLEADDVLRQLQKIKPDVIYQRVACAYTGVGAYYARKSKSHMLWHVANDRDLAPLPWRWDVRAPFEQLDRRMIDYGARHASHVVVQNQEQAALLRNNYGRSDAIRIPNFHRAPASIAAKSADPLIVCWVANLKPHKRPEVFLRLAQRFRDRAGLRFVMIGAQQMHGRDWAAFNALLASTPNVEYLGEKTPEEVESLFSAAAVFVNTSQVEGFPNTFIQAWLRKVAVLSYDVNPDKLFDGDRYGLHAGRNIDALAAALARLIDDAGLREMLGARSAAFAEQEYSHSNLDRLIQLLAAPPL